MTAAVSVEDVEKTFRVPHERHTSFQRRAVELFRAVPQETLRAVDRVSFDVGRGEFFGLVGPNGSGKSTLLQCIAGIHAPDAGVVRVAGRLSPFLELGAGFKPELTVRENAVLSGILLGLTRAQVRERLDEIVAFADIQQFADQRLKNLSSGMKVRLAFSLAVQVDADTLLLDEVLAVGDEAFKRKCFDQFAGFRREGRTVLLVTHNMGTIERFCDRALLLDRGRVQTIGEPATVVEAYEECNARLVGERAAARRRRRSEASQGQVPARGPAFADAGPPTTYLPSGLGDDLRGFARLTGALARTEFKLHYEGSVLGYLWSVMQPLMLFGVLYLVFSGVVGLGRRINDYPLYVLSAVVLWTYFTEATGGGVTSLVRAQGLLRKLRFPSLAIPVSVSLKALLNLGLNGLVVLAFALATGARPRLAWLELPLLVGLLVALGTGMTMLLSTLYVRYRDTQQIWRVIERVLFFASPIFYPASLYPDAVRELVALTPLVAIFAEMHHIFVDPTAPSAAALAGDATLLTVPVAVIATIFVLGLVVFNRQAPRIAERL